MHQRWSNIYLAASLIVLSACNSSSSPAVPRAVPTGGLDGTGLESMTVISVPNVAAGSQAKPFTYDFAQVDSVAGKYYLPDRTNSALDIVDISHLQNSLVEVPGFTGIGPTNSMSGPNDVAIIPNTPLLYVTDVDAVKILNTQTAQVTQSIATSSTGLRSDADCYDADDKIVMADNGTDTPPFAAYISTTSNTVTSKLTFTTSAGLEACLYDPGTKNFYINNDGTPTNPSGELDVIPASSVVAGNPVISASYSEGNCGPGGIALGPNEELGVACDAPSGDPQITLIMSATSGSILQTIAQVGGTDQIAYDAHLNRFYTASRNMTTTGISGGTLNPVLGVIDARSMAWIGNIPTSPNSHSVAVDSANGDVFVPIAASATTAGGIEVFGPTP